MLGVFVVHALLLPTKFCWIKVYRYLIAEIGKTEMLFFLLLWDVTSVRVSGPDPRRKKAKNDS